MYDDPNVTERRILFALAYASDDDNAPEMHGEIIERVSELADSLGHDLVVFTDVTAIVRAAVEYAASPHTTSEVSRGALVSRLVHALLEGVTESTPTTEAE